MVSVKKWLEYVCGDVMIVPIRKNSSSFCVPPQLPSSGILHTLILASSHAIYHTQQQQQQI